MREELDNFTYYWDARDRVPGLVGTPTTLEDFAANTQLLHFANL
jgi:hypothetical protein